MGHALKIACVEIQRRIFLISGDEINLIYVLYPRIVAGHGRNVSICLKQAGNR